MTIPRVALVTGANRGIGKEVCRQLADLDYRVILASRDYAKGILAANDLGYETSIIQPVQLDVTDDASVNNLKLQVEKLYGGTLDILINNAGINYDTWQHVQTADLQNVQETMETNLYGPWRMTMAFLPLLENSENPIVVNVSSGAGALTDMGATEPAYSVSKAALNALTIKLSKNLPNVKVNAVCPGWIATDMGGPGGGPIEKGAESVVWAATLGEDGPTGGFFRYGERIPW